MTRGPNDHFLANYFGIDAWSPDFRYLVALETDIRDQLPDGRPCTVGLVDLADANRFIPVMETRTRNLQEAAMDAGEAYAVSVSGTATIGGKDATFYAKTFATDPSVIYRWRDEMADLIEEAYF